MKIFVRLLLISLVLVSCGREPSTTTSDTELLLSERIRDTTLMDTLQVGVWKDFTVADKQDYRIPIYEKIITQDIPFLVSNNFKVEEPTILQEPIASDTIFHVVPDTVLCKPYISYITFPVLVPAGDLRKNLTSTESIFYLGPDQGLPSSDILAIEEDQDGNLWLGTPVGLCRYDGNYFQTFTTENGLLDNMIYDLFFDSKGRLWIGTETGFSIFDGKKISSYTKENGLLGGISIGFVEDQFGHVWFSCYGSSLTKFDDKNLYHYTKEKGLVNNNHPLVAIDPKNRIFVPNQHNGSSLLSGDTLFNFFSNDYYGSSMVSDVFKTKSGELWICSYNHKVSKIDKRGVNKKYFPLTGITYLAPTSIIEDNYGNLWLGTADAGIACMTRDEYIGYTVNEGLTTNRINVMHLDKNGNVWVGTNEGGLNKIVPNSFKSYSPKNGFTDKDISCLFLNHTGEICFSGFAEGVWTFDREKIKRGFNGMISAIVWCMYQDYFGNTIIGTHQYGTYLLEPNDDNKPGYKRISCMNQDGFFKPFGIRDMAMDSKGNLWMTDDVHGLVCYGLNESKTDYAYVEKYNVSSGLTSNSIYGIEIDQHDGIWLSYRKKGLSYIKDGKIMHYSTKNGLASNIINSIKIVSNNDVFIGTEEGLTIYSDGKFKTVNTTDELSNSDIKSVLEDKQGRYWIGTANGLNLLTVNKNKSSGFDVISFGNSDGLNSSSFIHSAAVLDHQNVAWWVTTNGLLNLNLNVFDKTAIHSKPILLDVLVNDTHLDFKSLRDSSSNTNNGGGYLSNLTWSEIIHFYNQPKDLVLPFDANGVTFSLSGVPGISKGQVTYRYRLIGVDENWKTQNNISSIPYGNLNPGKYSFEVQSKIQNAAWSESTVLHFTVKPPYWETWWFRTLVIISLVGLILWFVKWRNRKLILRQIELEKTVEERTREIKHQKHLIEEKQTEILDSINYAQRIQKALLASETLLQKNLPNCFVLFEPKDIVSGDFYWATSLDTGEFCVVTADSTGHGVPGAIMSMINISCLEKAVEAAKLSRTSEILNFTRKKIIETLAKDGSEEGGKDGMDCSIINFNLAKNKMTFSGANNGVYIVRNGELIECKPDKMPVGKHIHDNILFKEEEITLEKGDMIYSFTDGFPDQFGGPSGKKFKYKQLKDILIQTATDPLDVQKEKLINSFHNWKGDLEQIDDVCIIGVRI